MRSGAVKQLIVDQIIVNQKYLRSDQLFFHQIHFDREIDTICIEEIIVGQSVNNF